MFVDYMLRGVYDPGSWPIGIWPILTSYMEIVEFDAPVTVALENNVDAIITLDSNVEVDTEVDNNVSVTITFSEEVEL